MTETPPPGGAPEAIWHAAAESPLEVTGSTPARRVLDPLARVSEVLFGLIMVLTFTLSLNATAAGRDDVRAMLIGALGCNLAWGIIDAVMFLMATRGERALQERTVRAVQSAESADRGREMIAAALPPLILPALSVEDLERIRLHLVSLPVEHTDPRLGRRDYLGAVAVFLLVFLCTLPVVLPFIFLSDATIATRVSNAIAIVLLFLSGYAFGRHSGRPWRLGLSMVALGLFLVAIALALGG